MNIRSATTPKHRTGTSRLARRLIELGEYAKREGITPQDVKKCSEIGVLQLRLHKGRTYVVDMPVCSYDNTDQIDTEVAQLLGLIPPRTQASSRQQTPPISARPGTTERISKVLSPVRNLAGKLVRNIRQALNKTPNQKESDHQTAYTTNNKGQQSVVRLPRRSPPRTKPGRPSSVVCFQPGSISQLVQEMLRRAEEVKAQDEKAMGIQAAAPITDTEQAPQRQTCQLTEHLIQTIHSRLDEIERKCVSQKSIRP